MDHGGEFGWQPRTAREPGVSRRGFSTTRGAADSQPLFRGWAFTLLEILLVLAILGALAAIVVPHFAGRQRSALIRTTTANIISLEAKLQLYALDHEGEFPAGSQIAAFAALMAPGVAADGRSTRPYLDELPRDGWGQPIYYEYPSQRIADSVKPAIWSSGANQRNEQGGGDDINNWETGR